ISLSKKNVLRGLHIQTYQPQGKLITVFQGKIFDVALDLRRKSKTYGQFFKTILSDKKNQSIYIPAGFAHGFCVLEDKTLMHYKCTTSRNAKSEKGIVWNDTKLKIKWPITKPILSPKDKKNLTFTEFQKIRW
ncbi:dTDP-4-dehydrorhamnose 3,5-epimerase, partial [Candidatus Pelagibacter sp.]|nr:dTDP-4-dehydrorhamnose 3,5-epimerase [Candidatus Pelagibacter sp.]